MAIVFHKNLGTQNETLSNLCVGEKQSERIKRSRFWVPYDGFSEGHQTWCDNILIQKHKYLAVDIPLHRSHQRWGQLTTLQGVVRFMLLPSVMSCDSEFDWSVQLIYGTRRLWRLQERYRYRCECTTFFCYSPISILKLSECFLSTIMTSYY